MGGKLSAGTARVDISPDKGIELAGYPHHPRYNTGINDPLYASCLYLDDGVQKVAFVALDLLFFSKRYVSIVRKKVQEVTGIPAKNIMISCTHTHSGPWASGRLDIEALEKGLQPHNDFITKLIDNVIHVILVAVNNPFEAQVGMMTGLCGKEKGIGGNRRDIYGPSDPQVGVLGVMDTTGVLRACLINYALHPTVLHADSTVVSADYPGYVREYLNKVLPGMNVLFTQGFSGNQSTRYFRKGQTFDEAKRIGYEIGKECNRVLCNIQPENNPKLSVRTIETGIKTRIFPAKEDAIHCVEKAKQEYESLKKSNASYIELQNSNLKLLGAEDILGYILLMEKGYKIDLLEDEVPVEIMSVGIGDIRIISMPGEIFVEFGLFIKDQCQNDKLILIELANGCLPGYVYTKESLEIGGYETDTSMLAPVTGYIFTDIALRLLKR